MEEEVISNQRTGLPAAVTKYYDEQLLYPGEEDSSSLMTEHNVKQLFKAIDEGNLGLVEWYGDVMTDINARGKYSYRDETLEVRSGQATSLHVAVIKGHSHVVEKLLYDKPVKVNLPIIINNLHFFSHKFLISNCKATVLHIAVSHGHIKLVKMLLGHKEMDVNVKLNSNGITPLHLAAFQGHLEIVELLLADEKIKANEPMTDYLGSSEKQSYMQSHYYKSMTPLLMAVRKGHIKVVDFLFKSDKVDYNCINNLRDTALHIAVRENQVEIVKFLLNNNHVDRNFVNSINEQGYTPLHIAISFSNRYPNQATNIIKLLLKNHKVDVNAQRTDDGATPLHMAVERTNFHLVGLLLTRDDIDIDQPDDDQQSPFDYAYENLRTSEAVFKVMEALLSAGVSLANKLFQAGENRLPIANLMRACSCSIINTTENPLLSERSYYFSLLSASHQRVVLSRFLLDESRYHEAKDRWLSLTKERKLDIIGNFSSHFAGLPARLQRLTLSGVVQSEVFSMEHMNTFLLKIKNELKCSMNLAKKNQWLEPCRLRLSKGVQEILSHAAPFFVVSKTCFKLSRKNNIFSCYADVNDSPITERSKPCEHQTKKKTPPGRLSSFESLPPELAKTIMGYLCFTSENTAKPLASEVAVPVLALLCQLFRDAHEQKNPSQTSRVRAGNETSSAQSHSHIQLFPEARVLPGNFGTMISIVRR
jgi:ankyrin repeat protein